MILKSQLFSYFISPSTYKDIRCTTKDSGNVSFNIPIAYSIISIETLE